MRAQNGEQKMYKLIILISLFLTSLFANEPITLQLKWKHQFQFAGYYIALEKGYYKEAGLDVKLKEATSGQNIAKSVLDGRAEYGVGTSELILLKAKGEPLVVLGVIFQHSPLAFMVLQKKSANSIHEIANKKAMIEEGSAELFAYLNREKIDKNSLHIMSHSFDANDLIQAKVDVMSVYSTDEPYYLAKQKIPFTLYSPRAGGIDFYGDNIFTTQKEISDNPNRVKAFLAASLKGWEYAMKHKEEAISLILSKYNTQDKTKEQLLYEANEMESLMYPGIVKIGYMHNGRWKHMANTYKELGMLNKDIDFDTFLYSEDYEVRKRQERVTLILSVLGVLIVIVALRYYLNSRRLKKRVAEEEGQKNELEEYLKANSKNIELGYMIANISHQWREPLSRISAINLYTITALKKNREISKDSHLKNALQIDSMVKFLSETMQAFLEFYKPSGVVKEFDVRKSIEKILTILDAKIRENQIQVDIDCSFDGHISGVENEWMHIWLNILSNSMSIFIKRKIQNPKINITISKESVLFCDNGGGGDIEAILEFKNSGLGLKMCKEIAAKYSKKLSIVETEEGLCFCVEI